MDRDELKIKVRDAIWNLDSQSLQTGHWEDPLTYAEAALSAIEEAGYVIAQKDAASAVWDQAVEACIGIAKNKAAEISADEKLADGHMYAATCLDMVAGIESILEGLRDLKRFPSPSETSDE